MSTILKSYSGVMLTNHCPLIIAEQFGTLASLYPNYIDLGLGARPAPYEPCAAILPGPIVSLQPGQKIQAFVDGPAGPNRAPRFESLQRATARDVGTPICL